MVDPKLPLRTAILTPQSRRTGLIPRSPEPCHDALARLKVADGQGAASDRVAVLATERTTARGAAHAVGGTRTPATGTHSSQPYVCMGRSPPAHSRTSRGYATCREMRAEVMTR